jgi:hypothetical protein
MGSRPATETRKRSGPRAIPIPIPIFIPISIHRYVIRHRLERIGDTYQTALSTGNRSYHASPPANSLMSPRHHVN